MIEAYFFAVPAVGLFLGVVLTLTLIVHPSKVTGTANNLFKFFFGQNGD